jgi:hypothetical protein
MSVSFFRDHFFLITRSGDFHPGSFCALNPPAIDDPWHVPVQQ